MSTPTARPMSFGRGSVATSTRLTLSDTLTFDEWCAIGSKIIGIAEASAWWLGDWLFFGQWQYGKKYVAAVEITGLDEGTLRNYSSVAGRFDLSRRRDKLSFTHHQMVVALPIADADNFLAKAEAGGWSSRRLRDEIRAARIPISQPAQIGPPDAPIPPESILAASRLAPDGPEFIKVDTGELSNIVHFEISTPRARTWSAAAATRGVSVVDWAIEALDAAAAAIANA